MTKKLKKNSRVSHLTKEDYNLTEYVPGPRENLTGVSRHCHPQKLLKPVEKKPVLVLPSLNKSVEQPIIEEIDPLELKLD